MSNLCRPIALYPNPPSPSPPPQSGSDSDSSHEPVSDFPAPRIRDSPPYWHDEVLYPPSQPRPRPRERHNSVGLENETSQAHVTKGRIKRRNKTNHGLGHINVANTTGGGSLDCDTQSSKSSGSKRKAPSDNTVDQPPLKRNCLFMNDDEKKWLKGELRGIKGAIQQMADKGEKDRKGLDGKLDKIFDEIRQLF